MSDSTLVPDSIQPGWFGLNNSAAVSEHVGKNPSAIFAMLHKRFVLTQPYNDLWQPGSNGLVVALVFDHDGWSYTVEMDNGIRSPDFDADFDPWPNVSLNDFFRCTIPLEACND